MSLSTDNDLTLPLIPEASRANHGAVPAAAYVPIAVALIGVGFILVGGIKARDGVELPLANAAHTLVIDSATVGG